MEEHFEFRVEVVEARREMGRRRKCGGEMEFTDENNFTSLSYSNSDNPRLLRDRTIRNEPKVQWGIWQST